MKKTDEWQTQQQQHLCRLSTDEEASALLCEVALGPDLQN